MAAYALLSTVAGLKAPEKALTASGLGVATVVIGLLILVRGEAVQSRRPV